MSAGINHGDYNCPPWFDEVVNGKVTLGNERAAIVVKLERKSFRIERNPIGNRKVAFQKFVPNTGAAHGKIIIRCLHVSADGVECDDRPAVHDWRRIEGFSSAIVSVLAAPRA